MPWRQGVRLPAQWPALRARLEQDGGRADLILQVAQRSDGETRLYWHQALDALATWTPGYPVMLSSMGKARANSLAQHLANEPLVGVSGYEPEAERFAQRWVTHASNRSQRLAQSMILYEADQLIRPTSVEGEAQPCQRAHGDHVFAWLKAFHAEVTPWAPAPGRAAVQAGLARGQYTYWSVDGRPVSLIGLRWVRGQSSRIAPVYTPPDERQRGYASALVYHVAHDALRSGRCTLYADQDDPASNDVYRAVGFVERARFERRMFLSD